MHRKRCEHKNTGYPVCMPRRYVGSSIFPSFYTLKDGIKTQICSTIVSRRASWNVDMVNRSNMREYVFFLERKIKERKRNGGRIKKGLYRGRKSV